MSFWRAIPSHLKWLDETPWDFCVSSKDISLTSFVGSILKRGEGMACTPRCYFYCRGLSLFMPSLQGFCGPGFSSSVTMLETLFPRQAMCSGFHSCSGRWSFLKYWEDTQAGGEVLLCWNAVTATISCFSKIQIISEVKLMSIAL